ncbi:MAG: hypothetical protein R3D84_18060 [Paracoccaceae bacterium]
MGAAERAGSPPAGVEAKDVPAMGRQNWFTHVGEEHRAVREAVVCSTSPHSPNTR